MIKTDRFLVGTVRECVTEIVNMINWNKISIPDFDFCEQPYDDITTETLRDAVDGTELGDFWYGCRNVAFLFDGESENIVLLFGYYGGGGSVVVEINWDERKETDEIIKWICNAIEESTRGELDAESQTVFEIYPYDVKED